MLTETVVIIFVLGLWVYSILKFLRYWWIWLIPAPGEPYLALPQANSDSVVNRQYGVGDDIKLRQPWRFPSLVSLPLYPQKSPAIYLSVPEQKTSRSPSLPTIQRKSSQIPSFSCRSDSEPNISVYGVQDSLVMFRSDSEPNISVYGVQDYLVMFRSDSEPNISVYGGMIGGRKPSIVLTHASVERDDDRLPSNLSLGSMEIRVVCDDYKPSSRKYLDTNPSPSSFKGQRSITPVIMFPEHQIDRCGSGMISVYGSRRNSIISSRRSSIAASRRASSTSLYVNPTHLTRSRMSVPHLNSRVIFIFGISEYNLLL
ncbi:uncharacterized protein LOC111715874 [Eurytemora carolleeae]|uniref:uncharacterized protein LOC111715874 n=1 Tax=Eurytemora carolleeae TaxID=1294199 RepID=UPI000C78EBF4|nr:uncharacterized protein LOC111715874 [Eurytemora carolleeae]|eukprot:XP_023347040.1 uncharacterized protein LOC111715874 [Eurytemora affinis]